MAESQFCQRWVCFRKGVRFESGDKWMEQGRVCFCSHVRMCNLEWVWSHSTWVLSCTYVASTNVLQPTIPSKSLPRLSPPPPPSFFCVPPPCATYMIVHMQNACKVVNHESAMVNSKRLSSYTILGLK